MTYPDGTSTSADYNDKGQLATSTDVTGAVTTYVYDPATARSPRPPSAAARPCWPRSSTHTTRWPDPTTTRGNGIVTTNTYTAQNQLASRPPRTPAGQVLEAHSYTYDDHTTRPPATDTYQPGGSARPGRRHLDDRLLPTTPTTGSIGSAVYSGGLTNGQPTGLRSPPPRYTVDLGGDVVDAPRTPGAGGPDRSRPTPRARNTIDDSGR